ncbi:hypothetical protein D4764_04G0000780 [Takifugu flavidus]|uniref:Retrovirus-related Pol polyprotein from transposon TNT 1-94-like beta-barrel domain-containing protein n=1 Tax=Takifugu flavidus TaxID=433684 RepID=A0A5C6N1P4_9TELE|nr:hypothetical protein D4764_04G0000780 [Takifugu flavidus]
MFFTLYKCKLLTTTVGNRWVRLCFDGDERNYELWETKLLAHMRLLGLKETLLNEPAADNVEADILKNEEPYAEMIQFLDDKSLSLIMREAADNGRKALKILRDHYAGKGKPRIISLYTEPTSLQKAHRGLMVDTGATSHVITDVQKFLKCDESFQPQNHTVELADGTRTNGAALRRGDAEVTLVDREGKRMKATLKKALYVPTYPQDIFSVKAATTKGASVNFREGHSELIHKSGTRFDIKEYNRLYYLNTVNDVTDEL